MWICWVSISCCWPASPVSPLTVSCWWSGWSWLRDSIMKVTHTVMPLLVCAANISTRALRRLCCSVTLPAHQEQKHTSNGDWDWPPTVSANKTRREEGFFLFCFFLLLCNCNCYFSQIWTWHDSNWRVSVSWYLATQMSLRQQTQWGSNNKQKKKLSSCTCHTFCYTDISMEGSAEIILIIAATKEILTMENTEEELPWLKWSYSIH